VARREEPLTSDDPNAPGSGKVTALPHEGPINEDPPPTPPGRLHGLSIAGMAVSALVGIVAIFAFFTINWHGDSARYVVFAFVAAGVGFLTFASMAVLSAARDTYPRGSSSPASRR
jgi:hypothetical protein